MRSVVFQRFAKACLLGIVALLSGQGCPSNTTPNVAPSIVTPTIAGTLVAGQSGSVTIVCTAADIDGTVQSVNADLSLIGGYDTQPLAVNGDQWSWSGWVAPSTAGSITLILTATDNQGASTTEQITVTVRPADPATLVLDLGNTIIIELVRVPAGSFQMGTDSADLISLYQLGIPGLVNSASWSNASRPVHTVTFAQPLYMGKYPITHDQWQAVMDNDPTLDTTQGNYPIGKISWNQAVSFCETLSTRLGRTVRLPSEAEWEYACKAGGGETKYSFGNNENDLGQYAWFNTNSNTAAHPVGQKLPNALGLYDMHGLVWEWCQDFWHNTYDAAPADGIAWYTGGDTAGRVLRGGSWANTAGAARSAFRNWFGPEDSYADFGFRVVVP